jgi:hypothetical protein
MNTALASVHPARATGSLATDGVDDPGTANFAGSRRSKRLLSPASLFVLMALGLCVAFPGYALDLVAFTGITGPLTSALTQIASLGVRASRPWSASSASWSRSSRWPRCATSARCCSMSGWPSLPRSAS